MRRALALAVLAGACAGCGSPSAAPAPLTLERAIPLPKVSGRIDHLAIDLKRRRLFVAALGNGTVEGVDLDAGQIFARVEGLKEPQGLAYLPATDELAVASGGDGRVRFYRAADLAPAGELDAGADADNLRLADDGMLVVGSDGLRTIDPRTRTVVRTVALGAHPEGFRLDGSRFFVNLPRAGKIATGDLKTGVTAVWKAAYAMNFPMAYDPSARRIAVVYRLPAHLVLMDAGTGAVVSDRTTCGDSDDVFFDAKRQRIYVSCGGGSIDVFPIEGKRLARIDSRGGARTSLFVPEFDRLYVAARAGANQDAAILVYRPEP